MVVRCVWFLLPVADAGVADVFGRVELLLVLGHPLSTKRRTNTGGETSH